MHVNDTPFPEKVSLAQAIDGDMRIQAGIALSALVVMAGLEPGTDRMWEAFQRPPDDCRIMMRWWWFGPAVTKPELEREMRLMKDGGIGGFEVQPVYPLALDEPSEGLVNLPFLSPEFLDALRFTGRKARELGLRVDLTLGSGWPYGGPHVPISQAAGRLRFERLQVAPGRRIAPPVLAQGEKLLATFYAGSQDQAAGGRELSPASFSMAPASGEPGQVLFVISSRTGMMVKRASVGAEGLVLDHLNRAALERHLGFVGEPLLGAFGKNPPHAIFCDSLEVFGSDWTPDFLDEFRKRRGYDLKPHLPALAVDVGPVTGAVRNDWGATLTELCEERFLAPLAKWARERGTRLRVQNYGVPPVSLASNSLVDLPEGEGSHWNQFTTSRWASSAAHLLGRNITSSETWTWLHSPAFRATPLDMKAEADRHFLQGINQLIGHGWPYSPENAGTPGWRFYAAAVFNQQNPWWIVMPDIAAYLQRVSFLMRQGKPVNDVALYLPTSDARAAFVPGEASVNRTLERMLGPELVARILEAGFGLDCIDDGIVRQHGRVENGALAINGNRYRAVVLPNVERIPLDTYRTFEAFARSGGVVLATRRAPSLAPGLMEAAEQTPEISAISRRLFEGPGAPGHLVADEGAGLRPRLAALVRPDVSFSPAAPEIGFVHRSTGSAEVYFVANTGNTRRRVEATFRVAGMHPEWWDPMLGTRVAARVDARPKGGVTVSLDLEPYGSRVLVFSQRPAAGPGQPARLEMVPVADLSAGWEVAFNGRKVPYPGLRSWTDDPETRFYSGQATYEKTFQIPKDSLHPGAALWLQFGDGKAVPEAPQKQPGMRAWLDAPVREAAVVYVNGKRGGTVWAPPYSLDITQFVRPGENAIRVVVANLAINRMAGEPQPDYGPLHSRYGRRFDPQDMENVQPLPSGLLGPVRLVAAVKR